MVDDDTIAFAVISKICFGIWKMRIAFCRSCFATPVLHGDGDGVLGQKGFSRLTDEAGCVCTVLQLHTSRLQRLIPRTRSWAN